MITENKSKISLSAIDPIVISNIPSGEEKKVRGKSYISWGTDNLYPNYLWSLYNEVATLQSIINGTADYVCGNDIYINIDRFKDKVNNSGDTIVDLIRRITFDKLIFGGFAIQVIRDYNGEISEIYPVDFLKLRSDLKNEEFYYAEDWSAWSAKSIIIPKFGNSPSSIYYNKGSITRSTYPIPIYGAAIIPCELEKSINEFHLNNINNGFLSNVIINFNNGQPNDEQKEEIERNINEKFAGYQNAGRILLSFNDSDENKTTVEKLDDDEFDAKYEALATRTAQQIYTAFRAPKTLFGYTDSNAFSENEYNETFKLYNRTVVLPIQKEIIDAFDKIFNMRGVITIVPFSLTPKGKEENEMMIS